MNLSLPKQELQTYTLHQLELFFPDRNTHTLKGSDVDAAFERALERTEHCFRFIKNSAYSDKEADDPIHHQDL